MNFTPPLRGSQRDKGEARRRVGGGSFYSWYVPPPNRPSHKPLGLFVGLPEEDRPTLKGGVKFSALPLWDFFNNPGRGIFSTTPDGSKSFRAFARICEEGVLRTCAYRSAPSPRAGGSAP